MSEVECPDSWVFTQLEDICALLNGFAFKSKDYAEHGDFVIRIGNVQDGHIVLNNPAYIDSTFLGLERFKLEAGDLLMSLTGNVGRVGLIKEAHLPAVLNQRVAKIASLMEGSISDRWLFHVLRSPKFNSSLLKTAKGAAQLNISGKDVLSQKLYLSPLAEQKQIAAKLDELLAQVDTLKTRLDAIPATLKRFRQSVLAAAVSGRLTEKWREDKTYDAKEQLIAIREIYRSKPPKDDLAKFHELPSSWAWALVKQVGLVQLGRQRAPKYHSGDNMRPYLRVANVMEGYIDTRDVMQMVFDDNDFEKYRLVEGDILLNEGQSHELVGRPAMFRGEVENACFTNTLIRFRPFGDVSRDFSYIVFLSYLKVGRFQEIASRTVNISHLGAGRFADMEFPFPPIKEQTEIVHRVEQLFTFADQIEQRLNDAQSRVNHLTQSILAKAFRGELTAVWRKQNPDLISGEHSATALLQRIKEERANSKPQKCARKARKIA